MSNTRSLNNSRAGLSGICRLTTVALGFALALFFNINTAFADDDVPDPCKGVVFSTSDNEEFGCSVAAALHFGGTSLDSVRAHVARNSTGKRGGKWLERFNKNLNSLARNTFWAAFSHLFSRTDVRDWTDSEFVGQLAESASRLDVLHQHRRTDLRVRSLLKAIKEVANPPAQPSKKDCKKADPPAAAPPPADSPPSRKVP